MPLVFECKYRMKSKKNGLRLKPIKSVNHSNIKIKIGIGDRNYLHQGV